ncbi:MAG TPA: hypothetical protein VFQ92_21215 [Blastocatellia bacterium]|nr:hypothetical protein [Blastocatellia bacterium]
MQTTVDFEPLDIFDMLLALNPKYVDASHLSDEHTAKVNALCFAQSDRRLYLIFADAYVFTSSDGLATLEEVREINYHADELVPQSRQSIDAVVETVDGTVLLAGRDHRRTPPSEDGYYNDREVGVVWRKPRGGKSFIRSEVSDPAWKTSKVGNMTAGYFGQYHARMIALGTYGSGDAHFYYSFDDGLTWRRQSVADCFALHVHELYLPRSVNPQREARLWISGGDDPSGARSGVVCFDSVQEDGSLCGLQRVFNETPGYRVVSLSGNGKHVFIGNESLAGGVLKIQDNQESIDGRDFEYVFGKTRHDYHQFHALLATSDGILVSGSSSYGYVGDNVRADSGGVLYVSNNEGATFIEILLGARWVTSIAYDGRNLWFAATAGKEEGADVSQERFRIYRLLKPSPYARLVTPYVAKVLICDTSRFYEFAGYVTHPQACLSPGECTVRVDMTGHRTVVLEVETLEAGALVVEAVPFYNWRLDENPWKDALQVTFSGAERKEILLPETVLHNKYLRVRNAGSESISLRLLAFIGKN